LRYQSAVCSTT